MRLYYKRFFKPPVILVTRTLPTVLALLSIMSMANIASADDEEAPIFVETGGLDAGDCRALGAPCGSLQYALKKVGKNGRIFVGDGTFQMTAVADVIYMLSGAIDVRGSVPAGARSTLINVPAEFAGELQRKGFEVISDSKGLSNESVQTQLSLKSNAPATECVGGFAGAFACSNMDLLSHVTDRTLSARGADIWGFLDLNTHREYAIVGYSTGTAVFDVTDAEDPKEVGFVNGQTTTWRDIKVYQFWNDADNRWNAFAYVTADNASDGLVIIDLRELPHRISTVAYASDFAAAHNVFLTDIDFSTGLSLSGELPQLIIAGSNRDSGRFRAYSLATPSAPTFVSAPATPAGQPGSDRLYMHDAASARVTDGRKDTQCVNAATADHCDVLFDFNESTVDIWEITNVAAPQRLSRTPYTNADYVHSGWVSEDTQFLFVQDETDERDRNLPTTLRVFSLSNLLAPQLVGSWTGPTNAIDHNGFVRGNRYYMSNYARGLTVLDISNPATPILVGRFDTYPASDGVGFPGNWGTYPYLPSGNIALSDIDSGLFMVADNTLDVAPGSVSFTTPSYGAAENDSLLAAVQRAGGTSGAISVRWELIAATADAADFTATGGVLSWADGDASNRSIDLGPIADGASEGLERALIRLSSPAGGATLGSSRLASVYVSDPAESPYVEFDLSDVSTPERGFATVVASVQRRGSAAGALSVDFNITGGLAVNGSDYAGPVSGTLSWADGNANPKWIEYSIIDDSSAEPDEFFELSLGNVGGGNIGTANAFRVTIIDGTGVNSAPNAIAGGSQRVAGGAVVTLDGNASNDPDNDSLSYAWTQTLGPPVTLSDANSAITSFTAPNVTSDTMLRFALEVSDSGGLTDTAFAAVTVISDSARSSSGGGTLNLWSLIALLTLAALASRTDASLQSSARDPGPSK